MGEDLFCSFVVVVVFFFRGGSKRCDFTPVWTPLSETQIQFKTWAQIIHKIHLALLYFWS